MVFGTLLSSSLLFFSCCTAISVTASNDPSALAEAIFNGLGVTVIDASYQGATGASGTFTAGPFGIGSGGILTTGSATGALPGGNVNTNNGASGSTTYCGSGTNNGAILSVDIAVQDGYSGILVNFILASAEGGIPDPVGIFLDGTNYAVDGSGNRITATSPYLANPYVIVPPNSDTQYVGSSPPLVFAIPAAAGAHTVVFAICDQSDSSYDSGLMINAEGCVDCPSALSINYVQSTTTVDPGSATFTSTIKAIHTTSGTIIYGVAGPTTSTDTFTTSTDAPAASTDTPTATADTPTASTDTPTASTDTPTASTDTSPTSTDTPATSDISTTSTDPSITSAESSTASETPTTSMDASTNTSASETSTETSATPSDTAPSESATETSTADETTTAQPSGDSTSTDILPTETSTQALTTVDTDATSVGTTPEPTTESTSQDFTTREIITTGSGAGISNPASQISTSNSPSTASTTGSSSTSSPEASITDSTSSSSSATLPTSSPTTSADQESSTSGPSSSEASTSVATTTPSASATPSNAPAIDQYVYRGCLGSPSGYPSFTEVSTAANMTTEMCISLADGSNYVGIFNRSCYAADTLDATTFVADGTCDLPCPGDPGLFCGGTIDTTVAARSRKRSELPFDRRAAPADILLTVYALPAAGVESSSSSTVTSTTVVSTTELDSTSLQTSLTIVSTQTELLPATETDTATLQSPPVQASDPAIPAPSGGSTPSATEITTTVVTVSYTTVCPTNPAILTVTEACVTLTYHPCQCENQELPSVEMSTIQVPCSSCGQSGENEVVLTVPVAAAFPSPTAGAGSASPGAGAANPAAGPQGSEAQPNAPPASTIAANVGTNQAAGAQSTNQAAPAGTALSQVLPAATTEQQPAAAVTQQAGATLSQDVVQAATTEQQSAVTQTQQAASGGAGTPGYVTAMGPKNSVSWFTIFAVMCICLRFL